jgi:hypothetical protein
MDEVPHLQKKEVGVETFSADKVKEDRRERREPDVNPTQELRQKIPKPNLTKNPPDELMDDYESEDEGIVFPDHPMLQDLLATSMSATCHTLTSAIGQGRGLSKTETTEPTFPNAQRSDRAN